MSLTVQELIDLLMQQENKTMPVMLMLGEDGPTVAIDHNCLQREAVDCSPQLTIYPAYWP